MGKFIHIYEFTQQLFSDEKTARQASEMIQGFMNACPSQLSDIAANMPRREAVRYMRFR